VKLTVFQADKGDCLLLTGKDGTTILVDGGMRASYLEHVAPELSKLNGDIDLLYVSHIDQDHIAGVLQLLNDAVEWRVFDFQTRQANNPDAKKPKHPRPPEIKRIWHNAFHDQVGKNNAKRVEDALAASAAVLEGSPREADLSEAAFRRELATSVDEAIRVSYRVKPDQLGIPLNAEFERKLAMVRDDPQTIALGGLSLTVIGPFPEDLRKLRKKWNGWLDEVESQAKLDRIHEDMARDAQRLETGEIEGFRDAVVSRALEFAGSAPTRLGDRSLVTEPNLASLMLVVDEGGKTVLLTGDGAGQDILKGLERAGRLTPGGGIHVNVLKLQHHGSHHNLDEQFCKRVTADNYVICANGADDNPEKAALEALIDSRLGGAEKRGSHAGVKRSFKIWFSSSDKVASTAPRRAHMKLVEELVAERAKDSDGKLRFSFLQSGHAFQLSP
jgi:beta-lactamase superfamily II metal-dependent hydrolase